MKKMRTLFEQDKNYLVINKLREENNFIFEGNFSVSRKRDGTSTYIKNNQIYKRYDANAKKGKNIPYGAIACQSEPAPNDSFPVWVKCNRNDNSDKFHFETFDKQQEWKDGTYELCGEKINGNKERLKGHILIPHGEEIIDIEDLSFENIKKYLSENYIEGLIVKDNNTGLMTKIRRKDFGLKW